jgi:hypothetical protein
VSRWLAGGMAGAVVLAAVAIALAAPSRLGVVEDGEHGYAVAVPQGWRPVDGGDALLAYRSPDGDAALAITRIDAGSRVLGRGDALADALERGVERTTPGYRRERRKLAAAGTAVVVDLAYRRREPRGREAVAIRFVVLRGRTLALTVAGPATPPRPLRKAIEATVDSFRPFP